VRSSIVVTSAGLALFTAAVPARPDPSPAQGATAPARPWRLLAGASLFDARFVTPYTSSYSPPLPGIPHVSSATQTLPLDASLGPGLQLGLERSLGAHLALQFLGDYAASDLTGDPGQYDLRLVYTSRPPPSNDPVEVEVRRNEARPEATGRLKTWAAAVNLAAWVDAGRRARLGVSAGPAWLHAKGEAQSLVYTTYILGGHSVLFSDDHLVSFEFPASGLGLDVGAFFEADLGRSVSLRVDARYFWGPERDAVVTLREVVNPDQVLQSVNLADIQTGLAPAPLRLDPSLFRAALSLVIHF
jgi:hypothetical protein